VIYLLDKFDLDLISWSATKDEYLQLDLYETGETKIKGWLENERTRTIIGKNEITSLFKVKAKIQIAKVEKIVLKKHDKIIIWTTSGKYFVFRVRGINGTIREARTLPKCV
jgi:hypothetical protein